jgi:hypothetical protein
MGRNRVQFQKGLSLAEFHERYGTEEKCQAVASLLDTRYDPRSTRHPAEAGSFPDPEQTFGPPNDIQS